MARPIDPAADPASSICVGCGLCCDGTIFSFVPLVDTDDQGVLEARGLPIEARTSDQGFTLPCRVVRNGCCTIYEDRPTVCRRFRCRLLVGHEAGQIGDDEAAEAIASGIRLRDQVQAGFDRVSPSSAPRAIAGRTATLMGLLEADSQPLNPQGPRREDVASVLLDVATLRIHIEAHFHTQADDGEGRADVPTSEDAPIK